MDGKGVTAFIPSGVGVVNGQFGVGGSWVKFYIQSEDVGYSIQSVAFPGVVLRMDGREVNAFSGSGGGIVNVQFGVGPWEKFNLNFIPQWTYSSHNAVYILRTFFRKYDLLERTI